MFNLFSKSGRVRSAVKSVVADSINGAKSLNSAGLANVSTQKLFDDPYCEGFFYGSAVVTSAQIAPDGLSESDRALAIAEGFFEAVDIAQDDMQSRLVSMFAKGREKSDAEFVRGSNAGALAAMHQFNPDIRAKDPDEAALLERARNHGDAGGYLMMELWLEEAKRACP